MFAARQALTDFKENVSLGVQEKKLFDPIKSSRVSSSQKGLKSRSLNNYNSTNIKETKKALTDPDNAFIKHTFPEKENSKPKVLKEVKEKKIVHESDDWSDIEEMHIYVDPEDNYDDILPKNERIQKSDIDAMFMTLTFSNYADIIDDGNFSPPRVSDDFLSWRPDFLSPPPSHLSDSMAPLYDDTPLDLVELPDF